MPELPHVECCKSFVNNAPTSSFQKSEKKPHVRNFLPVILGPEMAAPFLWAPGIFWFFLLENPMPIKFLLLGGGGVVGFLEGGGEVPILFLWAWGFSDKKNRPIHISPVDRSINCPSSLIVDFCFSERRRPNPGIWYWFASALRISPGFFLGWWGGETVEFNGGLNSRGFRQITGVSGLPGCCLWATPKPSHKKKPVIRMGCFGTFSCPRDSKAFPSNSEPSPFASPLSRQGELWAKVQNWISLVFQIKRTWPEFATLRIFWGYFLPWKLFLFSEAIFKDTPKIPFKTSMKITSRGYFYFSRLFFASRGYF